MLALHSWSVMEPAVQKGRKQKQLFQLWEAGCLRICELIHKWPSVTHCDTQIQGLAKIIPLGSRTAFS